MNDETRKVLATAKGTVANGWGQGRLKDDGGNYCIMGALLYSRGSVLDAHDVLCGALGIDSKRTSDGYMPIAKWNDDPDRTQAEVVALFDKALTANVVRERESVTT